MTRWTVIQLDKGQGLGSHAAAWDALNLRLFNAHPLLDSRFIDGLLANFGTAPVALCILGANDAPQAMCLLRNTGPCYWASFLPAQAQIGLMLMRSAEHVPLLFSKLPGYALRIDLLCVDPAFSKFTLSDPMKVSCMTHSLTMRIDLAGTFDAYWANRSKNLIKNIGRYERRVQTDGVEQKFIRITEPTELSAAVDRYASLETAGWKGKAGTALGSVKSQERFYADFLLGSGSEKNQPVVYELWLGEKLAASRLVTAQGGMVVILKTTFDETLADYAPGRLLLRSVIQDRFATGADKSIEFYTDANSDQLAWATDRRWISHWAFNRNLAAEALTVLRGVAFNAFRQSETGTPNQQHQLAVDIYRHPDELPDDVANFFARAEGLDFQFGMDWFRNLMENVFEKHPGVCIFVLRRAGKPVAGLPLLAHKTRWGYHLESLGNYYTTLYGLATTDDVRNPELVVLVKTILKTMGPVISMRLLPMDPNTIGFSCLKNALYAAGVGSFEFFCFGNWFHPNPTDWKTYLANLRGTTRRTIKLTTKKFADAGGVLQIVTDPADLPGALAAYDQVYGSSWKVPEPFPKFIPGLAEFSGNKGWLRMGIAWLDGRPIAAQLWIVANKKANIYKLAYDENFKAYGTGTVLTAALMEHVIDKDHVTEVDFLAGDDPYKRFWMSERRERWGIIAYNPKTLGGMLGLGKEMAGKTLRALRARFPSLARQAAPK